MTPTAVVLAAGMGTRMKSRVPKVLHTVAGVPMVLHVLAAARGAGIDRIVVVVGHGAERVREAVAMPGVETVEQVPQLGSADAVAKAAGLVGDLGEVVILNGDLPLLTAATVRALVEAHAASSAVFSLVSMTTSAPYGYGRIVRDEAGLLVAIREELDATDAERAITEVNGGVYCADARWLWATLPRLPRSSKGEFYITDLAEFAAKERRTTSTIAASPVELMGINTRVHLAEAEFAMRDRIRREHMLAGVTIVDPATTYIDAGVEIGIDAVIHPNTTIEVGSHIGEECIVGPGTIIRASRIGDRCRLLASVIENSEVGSDVGMGPWCRVRGGAILEDGVDLGNYAEVKKSRVGSRTKMHHFGYLGDAIVGRDVNIGAGTITCNYDGVRKNQTIIGNGAFIGSDTMLVAPVEVGERSATGAGAVVTKDVPAGMLAVGVPARNLRRAAKGSDERDPPG